MKRMSKREEAALFQEFQGGDESKFAKIYQQFKPLVISRVNKLVDKGCEHLRDELNSHGYETLWSAAKTFNPTKGCRFSTYLTRCVTRCVNNTINRNIVKYRREREAIEKYLHQTSEECVVDVNSDSDTELTVNDRFPFLDELIFSEFAPFCNPKELAILGLIYNDADVWYKNGKLNNAAIARKLGISREAVRRILMKLSTNQHLKSKICELSPH